MAIAIQLDAYGKIILAPDNPAIGKKFNRLSQWLQAQEPFQPTANHSNNPSSYQEHEIMASLNRVILLGNLTRDPEVKYLQSGMAVSELGLAVNDRTKDANGGWVETATFVDVTCWSKTAETAGQYLHKGSQVLIEGRLKMDTWEKDGQKHYKLKVVCERLVMLGKPAGGQDAPPRQEQRYTRDGQQAPQDDMAF